MSYGPLVLENKSGAILQPYLTPLPTVNQSDITPSMLTHCGWGFFTSTDRNHIVGFVNRGARSGFCAADHMDISEMVNDAEDKTFSQDTLRC